MNKILLCYMMNIYLVILFYFVICINILMYMYEELIKDVKFVL